MKRAYEERAHCLSSSKRVLLEEKKGGVGWGGASSCVAALQLSRRDWCTPGTRKKQSCGFIGAASHRPGKSKPGSTNESSTWTMSIAKFNPRGKLVPSGKKCGGGKGVSTNELNPKRLTEGKQQTGNAIKYRPSASKLLTHCEDRHDR